MTRFGWDLPPGVTSSMIPGNRPEDMDEEAFWEKVQEVFTERYPRDVDVIEPLLSQDLRSDQQDALYRYVEVARDVGYEKGWAEGKIEADMAILEQVYIADAWLGLWVLKNCKAVYPPYIRAAGILRRWVKRGHGYSITD